MIPVRPLADPPLPRPSVADAMSVVLVDDDADFRAVLRLSLERIGEFTVVGEASDGATGVEVVAALRPDVVLLDIAMPRMDGIEALALLTDRSPWSSVVILTALSSGARVDAALRGGATGVIRKGSSMANMVAQLRGVLGLVQSPEIEIERVH